MIPGSTEWHAFVLSETLRPVREYRPLAARTAVVGQPNPIDELASAKRRRILCEAMSGPADADVEVAG